MKKSLIMIILSCLLCITAQAQGARQQNPQAHGGFSFEQYQEDKCNFIIKEMEFTQADIERFIPAYKELLKAKSELYHKYGKSRRVMHDVREGKQVPDSIMQQASQDARQLQVEDAKLEQEYLKKFEKLLTPVQVIRLQEAEQKFKNEMMKQGPRRPRR